MIAPVLPAEREIPHCGYFTGETTPPGCKLLMKRYRAALAVVAATSMLAAHLKRSLDVGPISKEVSKEARYWRQVREALDVFNKTAEIP